MVFVVVEVYSQCSYLRYYFFNLFFNFLIIIFIVVFVVFFIIVKSSSINVISFSSFF